MRRVRLLFPLVLFAVLPVSGCSFFSGGGKPASDTPGEAGTDDAAKTDDKSADAKKEDEKPDVSEEEYLRRAESAFDRGLYSVSRESFSKLREEYPATPFESFAQLKIADTHFFAREFAAAIPIYEEFLKLHPGHEAAPYARLQIGNSYLEQYTGPAHDQSPVKQALSNYERVIADFPSSYLVDLAKEKIAFCRDAANAHESFVADFYQRAGKEKATAERLSMIKKNSSAKAKPTQAKPVLITAADAAPEALAPTAATPPPGAPEEAGTAPSQGLAKDPGSPEFPENQSSLATLSQGPSTPRSAARTAPTTAAAPSPRKAIQANAATTVESANRPAGLIPSVKVPSDTVSRSATTPPVSAEAHAAVEEAEQTTVELPDVAAAPVPVLGTARATSPGVNHESPDGLSPAAHSPGARASAPDERDSTAQSREALGTDGETPVLDRRSSGEATLDNSEARAAEPLPPPSQIQIAKSVASSSAGSGKPKQKAPPFCREESNMSVAELRFAGTFELRSAPRSGPALGAELIFDVEESSPTIAPEPAFSRCETKRFLVRLGLPQETADGVVRKLTIRFAPGLQYRIFPMDNPSRLVLIAFSKGR